jgi:hypothetical protein
LKILDYFNEDIRSLDFSAAEVAIASIVRAGEIFNMQKSVKNSFNKIYELNMENIVNASIVINR